jgi:hypothetical protein
MVFRSSVVAMSTLAVLASLAACGDEPDREERGNKSPDFADQNAASIQEQVAADMTTLKSVRMTRDISRGGKRFSIDLAISTTGECVGTVKTSGGIADLIVSDAGQFIKGNAASLEAIAGSPKAAKELSTVLGRKWAKLPGGDGGLGALCDLRGLLAEIDTVDAEDGTVTIGESAEIDGVPALELISEDDTPTTAWVATEAPHYIVQITAGSDERGLINFSQFDVAVNAKTPPAKNVVDLSEP